MYGSNITKIMWMQITKHRHKCETNVDKLKTIRLREASGYIMQIKCIHSELKHGLLVLSVMLNYIAATDPHWSGSKWARGGFGLLVSVPPLAPPAVECENQARYMGWVTWVMDLGLEWIGFPGAPL